MYRCQFCHNVSKPNEPLTKVVTKVRPMKYIDRTTGKVIGEGKEIVEEIGICLSCKQQRDMAEEVCGTKIGVELVPNVRMHRGLNNFTV
jgi:hypothetical protein